VVFLWAGHTAVGVFNGRYGIWWCGRAAHRTKGCVPSGTVTSTTKAPLLHGTRAGVVVGVEEGVMVGTAVGTGVAVMYPITKAYKDAGNNVIAIVGARTKDLLILEEEMGAASHDLRVTTDDGSYGHHGFVTDVLRKILDERKDVKLICGIGPVPMMKFLCRLTKEYGVKTIVSLNSIMVDATGMCGACRVEVAGKTMFGCVDGPEFDAQEVDFAVLAQRNAQYREEERRALATFAADPEHDVAAVRSACQLAAVEIEASAEAAS